jgi:hypothetical protein
MGRVIPFNRRPPSGSQQSSLSDESSYPSLRPTLILILVLFAVAVVMTAVVAILVATSWREAAWFVLLVSVVALAKIVFATALFFTLVSSDSETEDQAITERHGDSPARGRRALPPQVPGQNSPRILTSAKPPRNRRPRGAYGPVGGLPPLS